MTIELFRIDDRLIHGQVVVGWGQPLNLDFIVLVDDGVAESEWEQELYRMGVPPGMEVYFESVESAAQRMDAFRNDRRKGLLLVGEIETMQRLVSRAPGITAVNVGGVHHMAGRRQRLRYVFLNEQEEAALRTLAESGVRVSAQDVPASRARSLDELLAASPEP